MAKALDALYAPGADLGRSAPRVARWLGDVRRFFPSPVVRVIQQDAMDRLGLRALLLEPELLQAVEADVRLVADIASLGAAIPEASKAIARDVVRQVVEALMARLAPRTRDAVRGALQRAKRTRRPRPADIDWPRTVLKNLRHYQPQHRTVIPETLVGYARGQRHVDEVIMLVDQSGSMASSVVYASIFSAVMAALPALRTQLVAFDTEVLDLSDLLEDPVDVIFGVQLGGGTDIARALGYVAERVRSPQQTHLVLLSDLLEGGDAKRMLQIARSLREAGVNLIVLLSLSDEGQPFYDKDHAAALAALGAPVFGCTPDQFPDLMAAALSRRDLAAWAAERDIALVRGVDEEAR
jgi:Mg-chelatase subunit ChlD